MRGARLKRGSGQHDRELSLVELDAREPPAMSGEMAPKHQPRSRRGGRVGLLAVLEARNQQKTETEVERRPLLHRMSSGGSGSEGRASRRNSISNGEDGRKEAQRRPSRLIKSKTEESPSNDTEGEMTMSQEEAKSLEKSLSGLDFDSLFSGMDVYTDEASLAPEEAVWISSELVEENGSRGDASSDMQSSAASGPFGRGDANHDFPSELDIQETCEELRILSDEMDIDVILSGERGPSIPFLPTLWAKKTPSDKQPEKVVVEALKITHGQRVLNSSVSSMATVFDQESAADDGALRVGGWTGKTAAIKRTLSATAEVAEKVSGEGDEGAGKPDVCPSPGLFDSHGSTDLDVDTDALVEKPMPGVDISEVDKEVLDTTGSRTQGASDGEKHALFQKVAAILRGCGGNVHDDVPKEVGDDVASDAPLEDLFGNSCTAPSQQVDAKDAVKAEVGGAGLEASAGATARDVGVDRGRLFIGSSLEPFMEIDLTEVSEEEGKSYIGSRVVVGAVGCGGAGQLGSGLGARVAAAEGQRGKETTTKWSIDTVIEPTGLGGLPPSNGGSTRHSVSSTSSVSAKQSRSASPVSDGSRRSHTSDRGSRRRGSVCGYIPDNSVITEAVSFFAVKHLVALVREISECLAGGDDVAERWEHVLGMQARAQRYINEAVRVNFEYDDLRQYQLLLPRTLGSGVVQRQELEPADSVGSVGKVVQVERDEQVERVERDERAEQNVAPTWERKTSSSVGLLKEPAELVGVPMWQRKDEPSAAPSAERNRCPTQNLFDNDDDELDYEMQVDDEEVVEEVEERVDSSESAPTKRLLSTESASEETCRPNIRTMSELKRLKAEEKLAAKGKTVDSVKQPKTKQRKTSAKVVDEDDDDEFISTADIEQEEAGDVADLSDPLWEARKAYMDKINANEISGMDLRVPCEVMQANAQLFRQNFEFSDKVNDINRRVFGYSSFRGVQLAAINSVLLGRDCFLMMATGGGKSHCYQLPSMLVGGLVVVFSPLISLMEDQMRVLRSYGINADTINASTTGAAVRQLSKRYFDERFENGSILFITPEKFGKSATLLRLLDDLNDAEKLKLFVIDEAHCVSHWGLSFRKDYRNLCTLKSKYPNVPILAMTATATPDVAEDIMQVLRIPTCVRLRTTINRPNLWIECREKSKDYLKEMIGIVKALSGCGIVYTLTVSDSEKVAGALRQAGISVGAYHAKLDITARKEVQERWTRGRIRVMVATIAFGMGIDKSDVRFVFHTSAPVTILGYYQEIGRAGRDGRFSTTILWYNLRDFERHRNLGQKTGTSAKAKMVAGEELCENPSLSNMREFCQNKSTCRRLLLFRAFGENPEGVLPQNCRACDNCCLNLMMQRVDATDDAITVCAFVQETMRYRVKGILTMNMLCDALRGSNRSLMLKYRLNENSHHGALRSRTPKYVCQVIQEMVNLRILREVRRNSKRFGRTVLLPGTSVQKLMRRQLDVNIICYRHVELPEAMVAGASPAKRGAAEQALPTPKKSPQNTSAGAREGDVAPQKGADVTKIVQALKAAANAGRKDREAAGDIENVASQRLPITRDNNLNLVARGFRVLSAPDNVPKRSGSGDSATNGGEARDRITRSASDAGLTLSPAVSAPGTTSNQRVERGLATVSKLSQNVTGSQQSAVTISSATESSGGSAGRGSAAGSRAPTPAAKETSVDMEAALHNNIRRKLPLGLVLGDLGAHGGDELHGADDAGVAVGLRHEDGLHAHHGLGQVVAHANGLLDQPAGAEEVQVGVGHAARGGVVDLVAPVEVAGVEGVDEEADVVHAEPAVGGDGGADVVAGGGVVVEPVVHADLVEVQEVVLVQARRHEGDLGGGGREGRMTGVLPPVRAASKRPGAYSGVVTARLTEVDAGVGARQQEQHALVAEDAPQFGELEVELRDVDVRQVTAVFAMEARTAVRGIGTVGRGCGGPLGGRGVGGWPRAAFSGAMRFDRGRGVLGRAGRGRCDARPDGIERGELGNLVVLAGFRSRFVLGGVHPAGRRALLRGRI
ncbi:ATP-dependent DNA helicase, RecQ family protein [Babesia caballi]|uniref:DNA 3'-5' helicase n=1 Tax=Babesia caballi TaxID=5871 RepID=A0AAV4M0A0_BABCB|nr:ATP-dependent DNA helicase, RecQ family protein [Babesia caballi]